MVRSPDGGPAARDEPVRSGRGRLARVLCAGLARRPRSLHLATGGAGLGLDLVAFGFAVAALILAVASLVADRRSAVGWLALAGSIAFPIWLVVLVQGLSGDAF